MFEECPGKQAIFILAFAPLVRNHKVCLGRPSKKTPRLKRGVEKHVYYYAFFSAFFFFSSLLPFLPLSPFPIVVKLRNTRFHCTASLFFLQKFLRGFLLLPELFHRTHHSSSKVLRRVLSSSGVRYRHFPRFSSPSSIFMMRTRLRILTLKPSASHMRRICRFSPWTMTMLN